MRAFIALELPEAFAYETAALAERLSLLCDGRFVPRENHHVTLAFLGDIGEAQSHDAVAALEEACEGRGPVVLSSDGLGRFGRPADATLWMGVVGGAALDGLAAVVRERLQAHGLEYDGHPFKPHVTLARRARLPKGDLPALEFPMPDIAERVTLFKSTLSSDGASYKPLVTVELGERSC